jgi:hypothetical protein
MARPHAAVRNKFNSTLRPDSRFAPLPIEGQVRKEYEPCLGTPKDACGVLERVSRVSRLVPSGTERVGSVFRITRRAAGGPGALETIAAARLAPVTQATLKHVIVGADGRPLPPAPPRSPPRSRSRSRSRRRDRRRGRRDGDDAPRRRSRPRRGRSRSRGRRRRG